MKDVMGLIYTGENDIHLGELTSQRAVAALPIAGRYRVIDFQLSSMVHSGIKNVGVITQKNYSSLMDHIGSGREWDLHGKQGLVILPPFLTRENMGVYSGLLDALKSNSNFLRLSRQEYIVLTNSHTVYNIDFTDALRAHVERGADLTILYSRVSKVNSGTEGENDTYLSVDENGTVTGMEIGSAVPTREFASLKVYITKRELLRQIVEQNAANGMHNFDRDILQRSITRAPSRSAATSTRGWPARSTRSSPTSISICRCSPAMCAASSSPPSARSTPRCATTCPPATWRTACAPTP